MTIILEVLVEGEEIQSYSFSENKQFYVGSHDSCDIKIHDSSISSRHLQISIEDLFIFLTDLSSTNGTFLNNKIIEPGLKTAVTAPISLRLGDKVLLSFLEESPVSEEVPPPLFINLFPEYDLKSVASSQHDGQDRTRVIDLKTLQKAKTQKLIKKRNKLSTNKKIPTKQEKTDKTKMRVLLAVSALALGGIYYMNVIRTPQTKAVVAKVIDKPKPSLALLKPITHLVKTTELTQRPDFLRYEQFITCDKPVEKYLCGLIPETKRLGVFQVDNMVNIMLDGGKFINEATSTLKEYPNESSEEDKMKVAALQFFNCLPADLNYEMIKDLNLTFAFYHHSEEGKAGIHFIVAIKGSKLSELRSKIKLAHFEYAQKVGVVIFKYANDYLMIY